MKRIKISKESWFNIELKNFIIIFESLTVYKKSEYLRSCKIYPTEISDHQKRKKKKEGKHQTAEKSIYKIGYFFKRHFKDAKLPVQILPYM